MFPASGSVGDFLTKGLLLKISLNPEIWKKAIGTKFKKTYIIRKA